MSATTDIFNMIAQGGGGGGALKYASGTYALAAIPRDTSRNIILEGMDFTPRAFLVGPINLGYLAGALFDESGTALIYGGIVGTSSGEVSASMRCDLSTASSTNGAVLFTLNYRGNSSYPNFTARTLYWYAIG